MLLMSENLYLNSLQKILKYFIYEFVNFKILCKIKNCSAFKKAFIREFKEKIYINGNYNKNDVEKNYVKRNFLCWL